MAVVTFGGITFNGSDGGDGFGLANLTGWYDAAPVRLVSRPRPVSDGSFGVDKFYRDARVITVAGRWVGDTVEEAFEARAMLEALQADGRPSVFTVTDQFGVRTVTGRLASEPQMSDGIFLPWFDYAFEVIADDPRKYGAEITLTTGLPIPGTGWVWPAVWPGDWGSGGNPGRVTVTNTGTATTYPLLEVTGGLTGGVELVEVTTGSYLRLERDIPTTATVYFDTRTGSAYIDDPANDITGMLTRRDWGGFSVPAGQARTIQFNGLGSAAGTPTLTVRYSPAY